ncbi:hypothetical protein P7C71_g3364, partial [Lecanoromycetidae sp. Uapishka_2]
MQQIKFLSLLFIALASSDVVSADYGAYDAYMKDGGVIYTNTHHGTGPAGPIPHTATSTTTSSSTVSVVVTQGGSAAATTTASTPAQTSSASSPPSSGNGWCINFTTAPGTPDWYWTNASPWTVGSGDASTASQCYTADDSAGGAIWIGSSPNPNAGNTKLECFFPTSGMGNCDVSLVDGYSLSVQCDLPDAATIGLDSTQNLWNNGNPCPGTVQDGYCTNPNGYSDAITDVAAFFQPAIDTCYIWQYDGLDPEYAGPSTINCTVSGSAPPSSYTKRDETVVEEIAVRDMEVAREPVQRKRALRRGMRAVRGAKA